MNKRVAPLLNSKASGWRVPGRACLLAAASVLLAVPSVAASSDQAADNISVRKLDGVYCVEARFTVPQPGPLVFTVLTDYEQIPRFMPDVRTSTVLERANGRALVAQEAVARVMMFSKRVHLLLDVQEEGSVIRFRDRSGKSFERYEGSWHITEHEGVATVAYQLRAKPSFDVPEFLLKRLLKRDAGLMIERLQLEIAARSRGRS